MSINLAFMEEIGVRIRRLRIRRNLTIFEVCKGAGIDPSHFSRIQSGRMDIHLSTFIKILDALDVSMARFSMESEEKYNLPPRQKDIARVKKRKKPGPVPKKKARRRRSRRVVKKTVGTTTICPVCHYSRKPDARGLILCKCE